MCRFVGLLESFYLNVSFFIQVNDKVKCYVWTLQYELQYVISVI